ncbi:hypothetical protein C8Q76DRAFT_797213 [Earliella scabrosa]|nr:hypothetical protein C8Q76DRAFT_797213 [Earliella scabrosa]
MGAQLESYQPTHHIFSIQDIVSYICTFATNATLASLASSCTYIHEPAIRQLWRTLGGVSPLVRCLPEDAWRVEGDELQIVRSPSPADWERFLHYSRHVRHLGAYVGTTDPQAIHPAFLQLWSTYNSTITLFPRLHTVEWCSVGFKDEQLAIFLSSVGPHLKDISITGWSLPLTNSLRILKTALTTITLQSPLLESIQIQGPIIQDSSLLNPELLLLSQNAAHLTTFRCPDIPITDVVFASLGRLNNITSMSIALSSPSVWPLPSDAFPVLRSLLITTTTRDYIRFSTFKAFPVIDILELKLSDAPNPAEVDALFQSICHQCSPASLRDLAIVPTDEAVEMEPDATISPHHLRPLLGYKRLTMLDVSFVCHYSFDYRFYEDLAQALPDLTSLAIGDGAGCIHIGRPSLEVLVPFALHCPDLLRLSISIDATRGFSTSAVVTALPLTARVSGVQYLDVGISPIKHPEAVAAFIARVFPDVAARGIGFSDWLWTPEVRAWVEDWEKVDSLLPWVGAVREAERQRHGRGIDPAWYS